MKKYILVMSAALLTTAAVTASVLSEKAPVIKKKVECTQKMQKNEYTKVKKRDCSKMQRTNCFQQIL